VDDSVKETDMVDGQTTRITGAIDRADPFRSATRIAAFVLFTAAGAQLAIPLPWTPVPVTMQTLFVVLAGIALGPRGGFTAMLSYLALGAAGVPVFAGFSLGPAVLFGPTGGYLVMFPAAAALSGVVARSVGGRRGAFAAALAGSAAILAGGASYLALIGGWGIGPTLSMGAYPFVAGEVVKAGMAAGLAGKRGG
jgi:biotin transport system substrate-specific component